MSVEVELKAKIRNRESLIQALREQGFKEAETVVETDTYYTSVHHDFAALDEALRVRTIEDRMSGRRTSVITYKGAKLDSVSMSRLELETGVEDAAICREILEHIGFSPVLPVEKQRTCFCRDGITACVDAVTGLGEYLELEIVAEREAEREEALEKLQEILQKLGYSMQETSRSSYLSMLVRKNREGLEKSADRG